MNNEIEYNQHKNSKNRKTNVSANYHRKHFYISNEKWKIYDRKTHFKSYDKRQNHFKNTNTGKEREYSRHFRKKTIRTQNGIEVATIFHAITRNIEKLSLEKTFTKTFIIQNLQRRSTET